MVTRFIGDTHGNTELLWKAIKDYEAGIISCIYHVGDIGFGFNDNELETIVNYIRIHHTPFIMIRGNHDNPKHWVFNHKNDMDYRQEAGIASGYYRKHPMQFIINGAFSIDQHNRTEGVDWWREEEHTVIEFNMLADEFIHKAPITVISHEAPAQALTSFNFSFAKQESRTKQALTAMFENHKPWLWVFGHYHTSLDVKIDGTRFICVAKDSYIDLEV